jgi:DNA-binding winged helix-turn-helix (wHTH) protein/TolB-like protein
VRYWLVSDMESGRFRFGPFEFDVATRELRREGLLVRLQSQPARVLACLIERAGEVVSRDHLRKAVWGDETFVDFERGLNFCISQIRSALKDDSAEPAFIRTIPKSGYQFIAAVQSMPAQPPEPPKTEVEPQNRAPGRTPVLVLTLAALVVLGFAAYRFRSIPSANPAPILAVLRFDNETGDPRLTSFSDAVTDNVVEQLTSQSGGRYRVIGNAQILRLPREQRDLKTIASSLHAAYVVLGQVQSNSGQIRILAHLIRLPDQTHLWVVRTDRTLEDPLGVESEVAQKIAAQFSPRVPEPFDRDASPPPASH